MSSTARQMPSHGLPEEARVPSLPPCFQTYTGQNPGSGGRKPTPFNLPPFRTKGKVFTQTKVTKSSSLACPIEEIVPATSFKGAAARSGTERIPSKESNVGPRTSPECLARSLIHRGRTCHRAAGSTPVTCVRAFALQPPPGSHMLDAIPLVIESFQ